MKKMIAQWALRAALATWTILSFVAICSEPLASTSMGDWVFWEACAFASAGLSSLAWRWADRKGLLGDMN